MPKRNAELDIYDYWLCELGKGFYIYKVCKINDKCHLYRSSTRPNDTRRTNTTLDEIFSVFKTPKPLKITRKAANKIMEQYYNESKRLFERN